MSHAAKLIISIILITIALGSGYFVWNSKFKSEQITQNPPVTNNPDDKVEPEKKDETENWKTYKNEEFNFSIKYPADWEIKSNLDYAEIGFLPVNPPTQNLNYSYFYINVYQNMNNKTLEDFYLTDGPILDTEESRLFKHYLPDSSFKIGNDDAKRFNNIGGAVSQTWVVFSSKDEIFEIRKINDNSYPDIDMDKFFNLFVQSFRRL